ncbi:MAG: HAMP domain-containing sensor histidine kinase [Pseudomonadota bacterium]
MSDVTCNTSRLRHSLLQPTAAIRIILAGCSDANVSRQSIEDACAVASRAATELEGELRALTDFLLLEYGTQKDDFGTVSLQDAIIEAVTENPVMAPLLERVDISDPFRVMVRTEADWLQKALAALIKNALEFSEGPIEVKVSEDGPLAVISITDQGIGIDPEILRLVGEPFIVKHATASHRVNRMGLGLAVTSRIAKRLQGHLDIHPHPEGGTEAVFSLPLRR